jgi:hypothetical protein
LNWEKDDPDTLHLYQESDVEWVKLWRKAVNKNRGTKKELTLNVIQKKSSEKIPVQPKKLEESQLL